MAKNKSSTNTAARRRAPVARARKDRKAVTSAAPTPSPSPAGDAGPARPTKQALIIGLLQREAGATLDDLVAATS